MFHSFHYHVLQHFQAILWYLNGQLLVLERYWIWLVLLTMKHTSHIGGGKPMSVHGYLQEPHSIIQWMIHYNWKISQTGTLCLNSLQECFSFSHTKAKLLKHILHSEADRFISMNILLPLLRKQDVKLTS